MNSQAVKDLERQAASSHARIVGEVETPEIKPQSAKSLTDAAQQQGMQYLERMRFGKHVTVSTDGEKVIGLIRDTLKQETAPKALASLKVLAERDIAEAQNYMGFLTEYGLFGFAKNQAKAYEWYTKSAQFNYQPALYNMAKMQFFLRDNLEGAEVLVEQAQKIGPEYSHRVCGLASYLSMRAKNTAVMISHAKNCSSPLAAFGNIEATNELDIKIKLLRDSLSSGASDGYSYLQKVTSNLENDPQLLGCKYKLLSKYRLVTANWKALPSEALDCAIKSKYKEPQIAAGRITGFIRVELESIQKLKRGNKFHFNWSVPFLPFTQSEVDLFLPVMEPK